MEFEDLKISENSQEKKDSKPVSEVKKEDRLLDDYMISNIAGGEDVLQSVKKINEDNQEKFVYGITDTQERGIFERIDDFFIDHSKISLKDKSYFFHMLSVMVDAGVPVVMAVKSLAARTKNKRFARVLNTIAYNCDHGSTLSNAMMRFGEIFDDAEIGIVKTGEATGRLDEMLLKLSEQLASRYELNMKLFSAAIYPIVVIVALILVATLMLAWVFPTLLKLLSEGGLSGSSLPLATRVLINVQEFFAGYWWVVLISIFVLYGGLQMYIGTNYGAARWDYFKLRMPVAGQLIRKNNILFFVSTLGLLIDSGLPVLSSLKIVGNSLKNRLYRLKVQEIINAVKAGEKISTSLKDAAFLFPSEVADMMYVGESSASLGRISSKVAGQYEREIDNSLKRISAIFGPVMILFIGVFVALLALAIMAPIYSLNSIV